MASEEEYENIGLGACILKKSASVTKFWYQELKIPAIVVSGIILFSFLAAVILAATYNDLSSFLQWIWMIITEANPLIYVALLIILPIPIYSTIWCIRHRRQIKTKKLQENEPACALDKEV